MLGQLHLRQQLTSWRVRRVAAPRKVAAPVLSAPSVDLVHVSSSLFSLRTLTLLLTYSFPEPHCLFCRARVDVPELVLMEVWALGCF